MNFKTTGILLALLIVVCAVWLFYPKGTEEPGTPGPKPKPADEEVAVLDPAPESDALVRVEIERPGKPRLVFERAPRADDPDQMEDWRAVEPLAVPVQKWAVNSLATTFAGLRSSTRLDSTAISAADAGLDPPVATVQLVDKQGTEYKLEVGRKAAMSNDTYVRVAGEETIHLISRDLLTQVKKDFNEYRDKTLCALNANDAVALEIDVEGRKNRLTRGADNQWVLDEPVKAYAERDQVLALVRKVGGLRVQEFVEDHAADMLAPYGLDRPYMTVSVTTETERKLPAKDEEASTQPVEPQVEKVQKTYALEVGGFADLKSEKRYARLAGQGWVVSVNQTDVAGLIPDLAKLRDPLITRVKANDATRLELTADGRTVTLERTQGRWVGTGDLSELEAPAVIDLLEAFEDLRAIDYILAPDVLAKYGLDDPRAVVTVTAGGTVEPVTIRVGDVTRSGRNAYVLRDGQPTVFVVSAAQARRLAVPPLSLRSRSIFNADAAHMQRLELVRGAARSELERENRRWKLLEPADAPVDPESVRTLVGDLTRLRARQVVGKNRDAEFGIDQPVVTVRFAMEEPVVGPTTRPTTQATQPTTQATQPTSAPATQSVEHTLRVGWKDTVAYCRFDDDPYIFQLDETVYRVLVSELIDRKLFSFKADDVVGLTTIGPGGTLELVKQDDEWKFAPDPFVKLTAKKVADFIKDVAGLRVESYVQYRDGDLEAAGLLAAPVALNIKLKSGPLVSLKLEQERPGDLPRLAGWVQARRIFRLRQADCEKLLRGLDYYLAPETGDAEAKSGTP